MQGEALCTLYANEEKVHGNSHICRVPLRPTTAPWVKAGREEVEGQQSGEQRVGLR